MSGFNLWKQSKSADYRFIDRTIGEYFRISGVSVFLHKYLGPMTDNLDDDTTSDYDGTDEDSSSITDIQDQFFKENRDRLYDDSVYEMKAIYNMQETEFDLSQFGLFLSNDTLFLEFHLNECLNQIGRKIVAGDVFEMFHMRDDALLDPKAPAINKFYAVDQVTRALDGWSATWRPHILRVRMEPITNSQEYTDILSKSIDDQVGGKNNPYGNMIEGFGADNPLFGENAYLEEVENNETTSNDDSDTSVSVGVDASDSSSTSSSSGSTNDTSDSDTSTSDFLTIGDIISNSSTLDSLTTAMLNEAQGYVPYRNYETRQLYMVPSSIMGREYPWIFAGDGVPPNGATLIGSGKEFPANPTEGTWFLNTSGEIAELFEFINNAWRFRECDLRLKWEASHRILTSYINNNNTTTLDDGSTIPERQALSQAILPKADF